MSRSHDKGIRHVVVLMLENRSFDHMLGFSDHPGLVKLKEDDFPNGVDPRDPASGAGVSADAEFSLPIDPPHSHLSVMKQLNGLRRPKMNGFVAACAEKAEGREPIPIIHWWRLEGLVLAVAGAAGALGRAFTKSAGISVAVGATLAVAGTAVLLWFRSRPRYRRPDSSQSPVEVAGSVMRCISPEKIPVLATLSREFATCTRWHCSVPGETWPNRNFAHAATSEGATGIQAGFYDARTIFEVIEEAGGTWHVYYDGMPQVMVFDALWSVKDRAKNWHESWEFAEHVRKDALPSYSFLEPRHTGPHSNSQHPGNNLDPRANGQYDFERGEALIAWVYQTLRDAPAVFEKTLLLITYDEHGGLFDHVPPPTKVNAPSRATGAMSRTRRFVSFFVTYRGGTFDFRTLGPRVPTIVVSPWVREGRIDDRVYDHSSIVATLRALFAPTHSPLTERDRGANTFHHLAEAPEGRATTHLPDFSQLVQEAETPTEEIAAAEMPVYEGDPLSPELAHLEQLVDERLATLKPSAGLEAMEELIEVARPGREVPVSVLDRFRRLAEAERGDV